MMGTIGVPITRTVVFWGLFWATSKNTRHPKIEFISKRSMLSLRGNQTQCDQVCAPIGQSTCKLSGLASGTARAAD